MDFESRGTRVASRGPVNHLPFRSVKMLTSLYPIGLYSHRIYALWIYLRQQTLVPQVSILKLVAFALVTTVTRAAGQTATDSAAIRSTALSYIDGWWSGDSLAMAASLHPELVKRIRGVSPSGQREWIDNMGASRLVEGTARGGGRDTPTSERRSDVRILDVFQNAASVRVDAGPWIDYMHLVKWNGRWVILNVLWENRRKQSERSR